MKRKVIFVVLFVLFLSINYSVRLFANLTLEKEKKLWDELVESQNDPKLNRFEKWNIIEGISLIKRVNDTSAIGCAITTLIQYYNNDNKFFYGDSEIAVALKEKGEKRKLEEDKISKLREAHVEHSMELRREYDETIKEHKEYLTRGVNISRVIEKYLRKNKYDVAKAVRDFAQKRAYDVQIIIRHDFRFSDLMGFIDKRVPFIIKSVWTEKYFICLGYMKRGSEEYLVVADLDKIGFKEVSHADAFKGEGLREKMKELDKKYGLRKKDMQFRIRETLTNEIEIIEWKQGEYQIYIIHDFKPSEAIINQRFFEGLGGNK